MGASCFSILHDAPKEAPKQGAFPRTGLHVIGQTSIANSFKSQCFWMSSDDFGERSGAAEETRTPDPIITNDVLYQLSYSGTFLVWPLLWRCNSLVNPRNQAVSDRACRLSNTGGTAVAGAFGPMVWTCCDRSPRKTLRHRPRGRHHRGALVGAVALPVGWVQVPSCPFRR